MSDLEKVTQEYPEIEYVVKVKRPSLARRLGCFAMIGVWLVVMMIPFMLILLAVQGEIRLGHSGDVPDKHEHPLLQINLVMEIDFRGLNITHSSVNRDGDDLCIQTNVRYLLWEGEGDPATFCDCYTRQGDDWQFAQTTMQACD